MFNRVNQLNSCCVISMALFFAQELPRTSSCQLVLDSLGFESTAFQSGDLFTQNGWRTTSDEFSFADVQSAERFTGNQSVKVSRGASSDARWAVPNLEFSPAAVVTITWDMAVAIDATTNGTGPFLGVEAYDDRGVFGLIGSFGVDATTGRLNYQAQDTGFLVPTEKRVASDTWNNFRIELDFESNTYRGYLNSELTFESGFVDLFAQLDELTDADISAFAIAADAASQQKPGVAYYDNFYVFNGRPDPIDCSGNGIVEIFDADCTPVDSLDAFLESNGTVRGDADGAGGVGFADFLALARNFGLRGAYTNGDFDKDGSIGFADFLILSSNFGTGSDFAASVTPVPEPRAISTIFVGVALFVVKRRSKTIHKWRHAQTTL